jgi:hypothetical protein
MRANSGGKKAGAAPYHALQPWRTGGVATDSINYEDAEPKLGGKAEAMPGGGPDLQPKTPATRSPALPSQMPAYQE